jgi:hypothetical protein
MKGHRWLLNSIQDCIVPTNIFLCMANNPNIQKCGHEELDSVIGKQRLPSEYFDMLQ